MGESQWGAEGEACSPHRRPHLSVDPSFPRLSHFLDPDLRGGGSFPASALWVLHGSGEFRLPTAANPISWVRSVSGFESPSSPARAGCEISCFCFCIAVALSYTAAGERNSSPFACVCLQIKSQQSEVTRILDGKNIKYNLVDISQDNALREEMRAKSGNPKAIPPQIFNGDRYCGVSGWQMAT